MSSEPRSELGVIVPILVEEGMLTREQVDYALRVQSKLSRSGPLITVLTELGHITDEDVATALTRRRLDIPIGGLLVDLGIMTEEDLRVALEIQNEEGAGKKKLGEVLVQQRFVDERRLCEILSYQLGFRLVEPRMVDLDRALLNRANPSWLDQNQFLPIHIEEDGRTLVAFSDPTNPVHVEAARRTFGDDLILGIAAPSALREVIARLDSSVRPASRPVSDNAVVELVDEILCGAVAAGASDIHVEPLASRLRVRYRIDGVLVRHAEYPSDLAKAIASRIKVLCQADITERRRHQDARLFYVAGDEELDLRVSIYVTVHGEKIVLRLLSRSRKVVGLRDVGMCPRVLDRFFFDALDRPSGVILITGPTGSGKTSTLYSCVNEIISPDTSIITAEDPVEYVIDGISQCSIDPEHGRGFDHTLKQIVRQDPDVIVIGEIRDAFSADTAIQAALTGHKVLTTFHTEDTIGGLVRLLNMEIEAFLVSSTVVSVLAQRLLRRVCDACAAAYNPTPDDLRRLGYSGSELDGAEFKLGRGCDQCRHTGYSGRIAVFELLVMDEVVRDAILNRRTSHEIRRMAREVGDMLSLLEDGIGKAARGVTTIQEVVRTLPRLDKPRPLRELRRLQGE